jgi:hypothetical protein
LASVVETPQFVSLILNSTGIVIIAVAIPHLLFFIAARTLVAATVASGNL